MKAFENIVGKGENAGNQLFLQFPTMSSIHPKTNLIFESHLFCHLQILSICTGLKFCHLQVRLSMPSKSFFNC